MSRLGELFSLEGRTALVTGGSAGIGEMIARAWDRVLDLNVKSVFHWTRALIPKLEAAGF